MGSVSQEPAAAHRLVQARVSSTEVSHRVLIDRMAWDRNNLLATISCHGPLPILKAIKAGLHANNLPMQFKGIGEWTPNIFKSTGCQYRVQLVRHAYNEGHLVAYQDVRGLILNLTDESLWRILKDDSYTTPVLRQWVPWLMSEMRRQGYLQELNGLMCQVHQLHLTTEDLDGLVAAGLAKRHLTI